MIIAIIIISSYIILILSYRIGWNRLKSSNLNTNFPTISVVIALRNEEKNIERLMYELSNQSYDYKKTEFIMIDDHSTDNTFKLLCQYQEKKENLITFKQDKKLFGKKEAIIKGIKAANGKIIITTDADCSFHNNWLSNIVNYFNNQNVKLVVGPVQFFETKNFWGKFQELEFLSLVGSGASSIGLNRGIFCNGANLAYRKSLITENNNKIFKQNIISGDDVFLMHYIKDKFPNGVVFAKNKEAIVKTHAVPSLGDFFNQRKRWAAKSIAYRDFDAVLVGFIVLLTNLLFLFLIIGSFFYRGLLYYVLIFLVLKFLVDTIFLAPILNFFKRRSLLKFILFFEFIYSFYIILTVIMSFTSSFKWKGRKHKK